MPSIELQMISVYCFVDDYLTVHPSLEQWRTSPNAHPRFTDREVITIALLQGCLGVATLKEVYRFIADNYRDAFPRLCSYGQWMARLHQLTPVIGVLIQAALISHPMNDPLYLMDSKPIPVCKPLRHGRARLLSDEGAFFGKTSAGWFYGFKLHLLCHHSGTILSSVLTPGNWDDRQVALALAWSISGGIVLADWGYSGDPIKQELAQEAGLLLITPQDAGKKGTSRRTLISCLRERIETTLSALWSRFIDRVYSRSWNGLWNTIKLKMLHFNLCQAGIIPS